MNLLAELQKTNPRYSEWDLEQYQFWREKKEFLDQMILDIYRKRIANESEAEAFKRLGKLDQWLAIKCVIIETDKIILKIGVL